MACSGCGKTSKLKSILSGFKNVIWQNEEAEAMAMERAKICSECSLNKGIVCKECGCYINAKIRSKTERCPISKWEQWE